MIEWLLLAVLVMLSVVDIIWKRFPSGFMTGLVFMIIVIAYLQTGEVALVLGVFSFIIAWAFLEFGVPINGVADLKVIVMIGCLLKDLRFLFLFIAMIMVIGLAYQLILIKFLKVKEDEDMPFIPVLTACYIALLVLGGIV